MLSHTFVFILCSSSVNNYKPSDLCFPPNTGAYNIQNNNSNQDNSYTSSSTELSTATATSNLAAVAAQLAQSTSPSLPPVANAPLPNVQQQLSPSATITPQILGSTPLSQIGCPPLPLDQYAGQLSPCGSSDEMDSEIDSNNDDLSSNFSNTSGSKRQKRGILPKQATSVMRAWLFQHLVVGIPEFTISHIIINAIILTASLSN